MTRRFAWPADSRPVVEVYGGWRNAAREAAMQAESRRLVDRRFAAAKTWQDLCELSAQFCEGKLPATPDHGGPRCPETVPIAAELAHANRQGLLTTCSQSGVDESWGDSGERFQQRPAVEGYASPKTVRKLRALIAGTRLEMQVAEKRPQWRTDFSNGVNVTRSLWPDGAQEWHTGFGVIPSRRAHFSDLGRSDLTEGAHVVTIYDPEYGDHRLLWDRLGQPDWDKPTPPAETPMPTGRLSDWIDTRPDLPICGTCQGEGRRAVTDPDVCPTCRGWGREDDGRPCPPVWSETSKQWIDPSTGQSADPPNSAEGASVNQAVAGVIHGISQITPTGLIAKALSGVTGKDIRSPLAEAAGASAASGGTAAAGGTGMSHASEGNAQIQQAGQDIEAANGALQEIINQLNAAQQNLLGAAEESQHSEADAAQAALQQAITAAEELQQTVGTAKQAVEEVRL